MKKWIVLLLVSLFVMPTQGSYAFWWKKKKKNKADTTAVAPKPKSKYEKLFEGKKSETAKSDFITIHRIGGKLYFELPIRRLGEEMLLASTIAATSNNEVAVVGYKPTAPLHVKFSMKDSTVFLKQINTRCTYDEVSRKSIAESQEAGYTDEILEKFMVEAYNRDSSAVVVEVTPLFTRDIPYLSPLSSYMGYLSVNGNVDPKYTSLEEIKAFEDNVTVNTTFMYNYMKKMMGVDFGGGKVLLKATRTFLLLPKEKMRPRVSDSRVGIFLTEKKHLKSGDAYQNYSLANRWRIEPKDMEAWKRGELVEPKKPIVFYLDDALPEQWKEPTRRGALRWNKAFEKIGFKNVVQVMDFPKNDPDFDPANLKYSCIRYVPVAIENAMGPSWVDPTTGEIINASVLIYNDLVGLINEWRFVQTAQIDPRVRGKRIADDVMAESIEYAVAHEVGHCLGLMHNMTASAAIPVDSLRSATFTRKYGTTASIMDYARFNYVAQPGDKGVTLSPPYLGVYDEFAIEWSYKPVPEAKSLKEETAVVESWVDAKAGDPMYRYGKQQILSRFDPSALEEDLGDDPIKAGDYGIKNLKYIMAHLNEWVQDDPSGEYKAKLYDAIVMQYFRYLGNVVQNIGGIYLSSVKEGTPGHNKRPVPKDAQKASVKWLFKQVRSSGWLTKTPVVDKIPLDVPMSYNMLYVVDKFFGSWMASRVALSSVTFPNTYTEKEFSEDVFNEIWKPTMEGRRLTHTDQLIQKSFFKKMTTLWWMQNGIIAGFADHTAPSPSSGYSFAPSVDEINLYGLDPSGMTKRYLKELKELESRYGQGVLAAQMEKVGFGAGYGWQRSVDVTRIDVQDIYMVYMVQKSINLLKSKLPGSTGSDRIHYQGMLIKLEKMLDRMQY